MKIKQLLLAAAAMVFAVACNETPDPVEPTPEPAGDVWVIAGSHQNWAPADAEALTLADGYYAVKGWEVEANTEFKFVKNKTWEDTDLGYNGEKPILANYFYATVAEGDGKNIKIETAGTYDVYLSEDATKFYVMEAGKAPAEAADAETIVVEPETPACAATAIIADEYNMVGDGNYVTCTFKVTTKDAVKAAYMYRKADLVDETYTADYILLDGTELQEGEDEWSGLNKENFEIDIWIDYETEYTFFLVVKDAEGLTKMVTKNVTGPEAPIKYEDYEASAVAELDTDYNESLVVFTTAEYQVRVTVNTLIETNMEYSMYDEEWNNEVYVTSAMLLTPDGDPISRLSTGTLGIYDSMWSGQYTEFRGSGVDGDGKSVIVYVSCPGALNGLGGAAGTMNFVVESAKFYHSNDNEWGITPNDKRYILEVNSTDGLQAVFTIDNYYSLDTFEGTTPFLNGQFMAYDPEYPDDPCVNLEESWMTMHAITEFTYLMVQTAMPDMDMNYVQGMFSAASHMSGATVAVTMSHNEPIAMYTEGGAGANNEISLENAVFEIYGTKDNVVNLVNFGTTGNLNVYLTTEDGNVASAEGKYYSVENNTLSGYYYDFYTEAECNFVEGGFTVAVVDGQYTVTVGDEGCHLQDVDATKNFSIAPGTYNITVQ